MTAPIPSPVALDPAAVVEDWEALLRAVTTKLRLLVGDAAAGAATVGPPDAMEPLRAGVLECAAALEQVVALIAQQMPQIAPHMSRRRRGETL